MTLEATVREAARRFGDRVAFRTEAGTILTYAELDRASDIAADTLRQWGVRADDLVVLVLPSALDYVVCYAAAAKLGAATAGVNPHLTARERNRLVNSVDGALVVGAPGGTPGGRPPRAAVGGAAH
ncbi:MAG: AMP-binding protein, partial [Acidimicrobiia bacterium]|nr:AMP-binding protein [Acidimicrobiia bacterium]